MTNALMNERDPGNSLEFVSCQLPLGDWGEALVYGTFRLITYASELILIFIDYYVTLAFLNVLLDLRKLQKKKKGISLIYHLCCTIFTV